MICYIFCFIYLSNNAILFSFTIIYFIWVPFDGTIHAVRDRREKISSRIDMNYKLQVYIHCEWEKIAIIFICSLQ